MNRFVESLSKKSDLVTRSIAGQTIIVPVTGGVGDLDSIYTLNETGSLIWQLIDGRLGIGPIVEAVCQAYEITPEEAGRDVLEFVVSLETAGLVRPSGEAAR
jgi:hypothetical protein